jgi:hypothetical protein
MFSLRNLSPFHPACKSVYAACSEEILNSQNLPLFSGYITPCHPGLVTTCLLLNQGDIHGRSFRIFKGKI